jgi:DNA-directed RNA polymerase subunit RPC12/RpoP
MKSITLACNECGAPLPVEDESRFVTCVHCGSRLVIQRREGAAWTELIEDLKDSQERLSERVEKLEHGEVRRRARFLRRRSRRDPDTQELDPAQALGVLPVVIIGSVIGTRPGLLWSALLILTAIGLAAVALWMYRRDERRWDERRQARRRRKLKRAAKARHGGRD